MRRSLVPASFLIGLLSICPAAQATSPTEQLRGFFGAATRILDSETSEGVEARLAAIRAIVKDIVDVPAAAQLSLGPSWSARTAAERDEFVRLFGDLLERSLISAIAGRIRLPDGVQVRYLGESVDGAVATVWTTILTKRGMDLPFTYRMKARAGGWAVRDVVIDGVSVAANYRAQFLRIIQLSSYQDLVRQMRARVPETLTGSLVAMAIAGEAPIAPGTPSTPPSDPVVPAAKVSAPAPLGPPVSEVAAIARSDPRLRLDVEMAVAARGLAEATALPTNAGGRAGGDHAALIAPGRDARSQPHPGPAARSAPASNGKSYWVQVGAFKSSEAARRLAAVLVAPEPSGSRRPAAVTESWAADTLLTRVRVGPFTDRSEAAAKLREMEARGYKPFIAAESE